MYQLFLAGSELLSVLIPLYDGCISNNHHGTAAATTTNHSQIAPMDSSKFLRVGPFFQSIHLTWKVVSFPDPKSGLLFWNDSYIAERWKGSNHIRLTVDL